MEGERAVKSRRRAWVNWTLLTLFSICIPSFVYADVSDFLLKFYPYISVQEQYSNNVFLSPSGAKMADYITTVTPGVRFSALSEQTYGMDLDFSGGYNYYAKNHDFNYWSAEGRLNSWYAVASNLTFRLRDYLLRSDEGRENVYQSQYLYDAQGQYIGNTQPDRYLLSTVRGVQAIYFRNVVEPSMEYRFGRENLLSVLYRNNIYRNQNPNFQDSMENTINPGLVYWFDIRNGASLSYFFTSNTYQTSPDQFVNAVTPRYIYRFNPRTSIFGEYHFEYQDFGSPGVDYYVHSPSLGIEHQFSPTLTGHAQVGYFWQIPKQGDREQGPSFILSLAKRAEKTVYTFSFQGGYMEDYVSAQNLGFTQTYTGYGTVQHQLTQWLSVGFTGYLARDIYATDEKDWQWSVRGNASFFVFRWLAVSLEAFYRQNNSTISANDYTEFVGMVRITAARPGPRPGIMGRPGYW